MSNTVYTRIGDRGQEIYAFEIEWNGENVDSSQVAISGNYLDTSIDRFLAMQTGRISGGISDVKLRDGKLDVEVLPFSFASPYKLKIGEITLTAADFSEVKTAWADKFEAIEDGDVVYRLYRPDVRECRPLILFLHGGGEGGDDNGRDNWKQLVSNYGPVNFAEHYPDCYVMAPQAKDRTKTPEELAAMSKQTFATSVQATDVGWNRAYLAQICDIIRRMIKEGYVDEKRVYVTGLSMGGAGTIRAMSVGAGLFAAAAPVCPSMTPETYSILCGLSDAKLWISTAYIDHTLYRHKYIVDAVMKLKDAGNKNVHLTLYSPEELAKYDIGIIDDMPLKSKFGWNHTSWVLTYHNEHGIMSWLLDQTK